MDWNGKRVLIIGGARQGQAAARWLVRHAARVTVNDQRKAEEMVPARTALADLPVTLILGGHPLDLLEGADVVCLSGGVPLNNPLVAEALRRGIPITNDTQIFMENVPCKTVGITGSAGKTTTTILVGRMATAAYGSSGLKTRREGGRPSVFLGGNVGDPLLNHVDEMKPGDLAILEISSFQLEQMNLSTNVAAVLNITPNHLDRHGTMEAYAAAKSRLLEFQNEQDVAVLGRDDPGAWGLKENVRGRLFSFGLSPLAQGNTGTFLRNGRFILRTSDGESILLPEDVVQLRGEHNKINILAACAIAFAAGLPAEAIRSGVEGFSGVTHRLEFVRSWGGADWYNDSIATAPERSIAAVRSFSEPVVLLLGGRDKDLPWGDLAELIRQRVDHVVLFGEAAGKILSAIGEPVQGKRPYSIERCSGLQEAVIAASRLVQEGDVVLLSPGGTSFDEFRDFEERGERFRQWVQDLS